MAGDILGAGVAVNHIVHDLFLPPNATSIPLPCAVNGFTVRLQPKDMAEPGWLLRMIAAQAERGGPVQILTPDGAGVAFVLDPAASVALAAAEPVVAPEAAVDDRQLDMFS